MTRYERREARKRRRMAQIVTRVLGGLLAVICVIACCTFLASGHEYTEAEQMELLTEDEPLVRGTPTDEEPVYVEPHETDAVGASRKKMDTDKLLMKLSAKGVVSSDTPEEDAADDEFELLCMVVMAEGGNTEPDKGIRYMADGILNRVDSKSFPGTIEEVCYEKHWSKKLNRWCWQFETVATDAIYKWVPTERAIRICAEEMEKRMNNEVLYWRTGYYHSNTSPIEHVGHHYYSGK